uniref:ribosomal protein L24 n=1 Tax=Rhodaphanes brevistipitata TaxID=446136 RepID=UPI001FCD7C60|nr:ribosomal protein L24 [Rhodaphanes brevistipitata]UNJ18452.1 ribosomal protein L24 [Rhodaphanes brevistipitata]
MKNSSTQRYKMHVKVGDIVKIIAGKEKGKTGKVLQVFTKTSHILVEGINFKTKHQKPKQEGEKGNIITKETSIHSSNVMLYSETNNIASRISYKMKEDGTKVRFLVKNQEII